MIDPQELCLGNWIAKKEDDRLIPVEVTSLTSDAINGLSLQQFEPLILKGEYLIQAGLQYNGAVYSFSNDYITLSFDLDLNEYATMDDKHGGQALLMRSFHFLHEVQNLIYGLTGQMLRFSLTASS